MPSTKKSKRLMWPSAVTVTSASLVPPYEMHTRSPPWAVFLVSLCTGDLPLDRVRGLLSVFLSFVFYGSFFISPAFGGSSLFSVVRLVSFLSFRFSFPSFFCVRLLFFCRCWRRTAGGTNKRGGLKFVDLFTHFFPFCLLPPTRRGTRSPFPNKSPANWSGWYNKRHWRGEC